MNPPPAAAVVRFSAGGGSPLAAAVRLSKGPPDSSSRFARAEGGSRPPLAAQGSYGGWGASSLHDLLAAMRSFTCSAERIHNVRTTTRICCDISLRRIAQFVAPLRVGGRGPPLGGCRSGDWISPLGARGPNSPAPSERGRVVAVSPSPAEHRRRGLQQNGGDRHPITQW